MKVNCGPGSVLADCTNYVTEHIQTLINGHETKMNEKDAEHETKMKEKNAEHTAKFDEMTDEMK
jgi:IMP dehydrogenase/GMP reductase